MKRKAPDKDSAVQKEKNELSDYNYLQDLKPALQRDPRAAYAFAAMMWRVGEIAREIAESNPETYAMVSSLVDKGIELGYEYTTDHRADHQAGLERFKRDLADKIDL